MREAKFVIQRPEYPDWFGGWNDYGLAIWTSNAGDARFVRLDELVNTLTRLASERPSASLYLPNDQGEARADNASPPQNQTL